MKLNINLSVFLCIGAVVVSAGVAPTTRSVPTTRVVSSATRVIKVDATGSSDNKAATAAVNVNMKPVEVVENTPTAKVILTIQNQPEPAIPMELSGADTADYIGEFESALRENQKSMVAHRSAASQGRTLRLTNNDNNREFRVTLCARSSSNIRPSVYFRVRDISFTNDGPSDRISVSLNGEQIGNYDTGDDYQGGYAWNMIKNTGNIGRVRELDNGNHTLSFRVDADQWGVELDTLTIRVKGQSQAQMFMCSAELV